MKYLSLFIAALIPFFITAKENSSIAIEKINSANQQTFLLPVDHTNKNLYSLSVSLPQGLRPLQSLEEFSSPQASMIEYVPENESSFGSSEIFTVHKFIGRKIDAKALVNHFMMQLLANSQNGKILSKKFTTIKSIEHGYFIMQYRHENRQEVIGAAYYSGPHDTAGAQYTIRLDKNQKIEDAVKKIDLFFNEQVTLINGAK